MANQTQEVPSPGAKAPEEQGKREAQAKAMVEELRRESRVVVQGAEKAMKKPAVAATVAGAAVLAAGAIWGASEAAVAAVAAYAVFRMLRKRMGKGGEAKRDESVREMPRQAESKGV